MNLWKLFGVFAKLLIISYAKFLLLWNIFAIFCWIPIGILSCVIPLAITQFYGISYIVVLKFEHLWMLTFHGGVCVSSLDCQLLGDKDVVSFSCLPFASLLSALLVSMLLTEHLVGSRCYYYDLLKRFWAHMGQIREHGLLSLSEFIVMLAPLIFVISLQKKQV